MERFYCCFVEGSDGGKHYQHTSLKGAQREAERLAMLPNVQGKTVYLFQCVGKCRVDTSPVKWEVPREDDPLLPSTATASLNCRIY